MDTPEEKYLQDVEICRPPDTCWSDKIWLYGICAVPCVQGLMAQQAYKQNMTYGDSGCTICYSPSSFDALFPCVCSKWCLGLSMTQSAVQGVSNELRTPGLGKLGTAAISTSIRTRLLNNAGIKNHTELQFVQVLFGPCCCIPCNNAAYVIAKKGGTVQYNTGGLLF